MMIPFFWALSALAALVPPRAYELDISFTIGKDTKETIRMILQPGKPASLSVRSKGKEGSYVDVVASEKGSGALLVEVQLGRLGTSGERTLVGTPQLIATLGQSARISAEDKGNGGGEPYSLELTPRLSPVK